MTKMNKEEMRQKLGNLSQIRELIFGEQMGEYERQFSTSQQRIEQIESSLEDLNLNLERFKTDIQEHLTQLKSNLNEELNTAVDSLDKKLKYLSVNAYNEIQNTKQEITIKTEANAQKIDLATAKINSRLQAVRQETLQEKEIINQDLKNLKQHLSETIEQNLSHLTEAKVSRSDMAEMLFELCLKFKGESNTQPMLTPQLKGTNEEIAESNKLVLLEETVIEEN